MSEKWQQNSWVLTSDPLDTSKKRGNALTLTPPLRITLKVKVIQHFISVSPAAVKIKATKWLRVICGFHTPGNPSLAWTLYSQGSVFSMAPPCLKPWEQQAGSLALQPLYVRTNPQTGPAAARMQASTGLVWFCFFTKGLNKSLHKCIRKLTAILYLCPFISRLIYSVSSKQLLNFRHLLIFIHAMI